MKSLQSYIEESWRDSEDGSEFAVFFFHNDSYKMVKYCRDFMSCLNLIEENPEIGFWYGSLAEFETDYNQLGAPEGHFIKIIRK